MQVRVLKVAGGKIQLTQKSEDERKVESEMTESGLGSTTSKKATNTLEAALVAAGFKPSPKAEACFILTLIQVPKGISLYSAKG